MKITLLEFTLFKTTYKLSINAKMPIMVGVLTFISRINTRSGKDKSIVKHFTFKSRWNIHRRLKFSPYPLPQNQYAHVSALKAISHIHRNRTETETKPNRKNKMP